MAESNPPGLALGTLRDLPHTAQLIGEFIVRWSLAEGALIMPLLAAINFKIQEVAAAMLASTNSTEGKIKLVRVAVAHMKQPPHQQLKKPISASLNTLQKLCEERNALCHHLWPLEVLIG